MTPARNRPLSYTLVFKFFQGCLQSLTDFVDKYLFALGIEAVSMAGIQVCRCSFHRNPVSYRTHRRQRKRWKSVGVPSRKSNDHIMRKKSEWIVKYSVSSLCVQLLKEFRYVFTRCFFLFSVTWNDFCLLPLLFYWCMKERGRKSIDMGII